MLSDNQNPVMTIYYEENFQNLEKFTSDETKNISQFINSIENIGQIIGERDKIRYCMCTAKLAGEARLRFKDNLSLAEWDDLKSALLARFEPTASSSKVFDQLEQRKQ
jgi:hypothetical protein